MNNIHNQWCQSGLKSGVVQRGGGEISVFWYVWIWALEPSFGGQFLHRISGQI